MEHQNWRKKFLENSLIFFVDNAQIRNENTPKFENNIKWPTLEEQLNLKLYSGNGARSALKA